LTPGSASPISAHTPRFLPACLVVPVVENSGPGDPCRTRDEEKLANCRNTAHEHDDGRGRKHQARQAADRNAVNSDSWMVLHFIFPSRLFSVLDTQLSPEKFPCIRPRRKRLARKAGGERHHLHGRCQLRRHGCVGLRAGCDFQRPLPAGRLLALAHRLINRKPPGALQSRGDHSGAQDRGVIVDDDLQRRRFHHR